MALNWFKIVTLSRYMILPIKRLRIHWIRIPSLSNGTCVITSLQLELSLTVI